MEFLKSSTDELVLKPSLVRAINRYLIVSTEIQRADLGFLFGGQRSAAARVDKTVELWTRGLLGKIIVSGGLVGNARVTEAETISNMLTKRGIPETDILLEDQSTNTGENVLFSIERLRQEGFYHDIHSVICIGRLSTSRRYLMTIERHWPSVRKMLSAVNYHEVEDTLWHTDEHLAEEILGEWRKLRPYLEADFIRELNRQTCPLISRS